ncbi:unnamed protein product [Eruca vesicaria subsp. sativa]|uniref:Uncharacterized protein n=1 Tax=Eruca vesicaria subsp. sativa TaxID=29727 RepID=A0ABC8K7Z1_ERUVS|nr:unnamed protein product [Eruca vesicaria subsp. sativa]
MLEISVSLNPAGSVDPYSVAFFSPDERGSYVHARGVSTHHVYKHITEHASTALQYFLEFGTGSALYFPLLWVCSFESLFSQPCSKCGRLLAMDKKSSLILPLLHRTYQNFLLQPTSTFVKLTTVVALQRIREDQ